MGCTWYPVPGPTAQCGETCYLGEELPPASQADVKISSSTYPSVTAAHNAFIRLAEQGTALQQFDVAPHNTGLYFQTDFWAHDHGKDFACDFAVGDRVVVIDTVVLDAPTDVESVASAVVARF